MKSRPRPNKGDYLLRLGVISDTHIPKAAADIPEAVYKAFKGVDMILHAGDVLEMSVLKNLQKLAPVKAVCGNMDGEDMRKALKEREVITAGGFRIGLVHGHGPIKGLEERVGKLFDKNIDVIVFGHSHMPANEVRGKTLFFNPGSPTDKVFAPFNTYGILEIGKAVCGSIINI
ncbi:MAG: metallophosphoesterase family protein [Candidatus Omnitrophota bacterium]